MLNNSIIKTRIFAGFALLLLVIGIPFTINFLKQQQITQQNAQVYDNTNNAVSSTIPPETDTCGKVDLIFKESASCPRVVASGHNNNITNYSFTIEIRSRDGKAHSVGYYKESDFCIAGSIPTSSNTCKENNSQSNGNGIDVPANKDARSITIHSTKPSEYNGLACGTYQQDFAITSIDNDTSCVFQRPISSVLRDQGKIEVGSVGFCETGTTCSITNCGPNGSGTCSPQSCSGGDVPSGPAGSGDCGNKYPGKGVCCVKPSSSPVCVGPDHIQHQNINITFPTSCTK